MDEKKIRIRVFDFGGSSTKMAVALYNKIEKKIELTDMQTISIKDLNWKCESNFLFSMSFQNYVDKSDNMFGLSIKGDLDEENLISPITLKTGEVKINWKNHLLLNSIKQKVFGLNDAESHLYHFIHQPNIECPIICITLGSAVGNFLYLINKKLFTLILIIKGFSICDSEGKILKIYKNKSFDISNFQIQTEENKMEKIIFCLSSIGLSKLEKQFEENEAKQIYLKRLESFLINLQSFFSVKR